VRLTTTERPTRKRSETRDLVAPMLRALNRMPGVRVTRNANLGPVVPYARRLEPDIRPILAGLGVGSADLVGVVVVVGVPNVAWASHKIGRVFCLEVKLPSDDDRGLKAGVVRPDQRRWLETVRRFGGFAAVVTSLDQAREAVARCRTGASE